jgi:arylformamidase
MFYDLSHLLNNESPVYPGINQPEFLNAATIEENGYRETHFRFHSHLGTHVDAPAHMLKYGDFLDKIDISAFCGKALIIETGTNNSYIEKNILIPFMSELEKADFVLFKTGWSKFWKEKKYFEDFPVLTNEALEYLLQFSLKGVGFDTISADPVNSTDFKNHYAIFEQGLIIIENLCFPENMKETTGEFFCFPFLYKNADGAPVRAVFRT